MNVQAPGAADAGDRSRFADYTKAILNILGDFSEEKARQHNAQKAVLNILDDVKDDRRRHAGAQKALLNILGDYSEESVRTRDAQKAALNILSDFGEERNRLRLAQRATLNILEDTEDERKQRAQAEARVRELNQELETRVEQRTTELSSANQELEAFVYATSHELRTPLRAIDGFAQAFVEDPQTQLGEEGQRNLRRIRDAAHRMGEMIDRIQALMQAAAHAVQWTPVDLSGLAASILADLRRSTAQRVVTAVIEPGLSASGDPKLLAIALSNLLGNAWKFTAAHRAARIEFGATTQQGERVFYVRDDGCGFNMIHAARLFAPFERLHGLAEFSGAGMGLSIVRRIVQRHGGRVWAEGAVEKGATLYFTLHGDPDPTAQTGRETQRRRKP